MRKVEIFISVKGGKIIITPPPEVEFAVLTATDDEKITIAELAERSGRSVKAISNYCDSGKLSYEIVGKNRIVSAKEGMHVCSQVYKPGRPKKSLHHI